VKNHGAVYFASSYQDVYDVAFEAGGGAVEEAGKTGKTDSKSGKKSRKPKAAS
jgi:hypothetical protein